MSNLYKDSRLGSIRDAARSWAQGQGMRIPKQIAQARELTRTVLRHAASVASGQFTGEKFDKLNESTMALLRAESSSNTEVNGMLDRLNAHLAQNEPDLYKALNAEQTPQLAGLGSHPDILRPLVAEQRARDMAAERAPTHSKSLHGHESAPEETSPEGK